VSRDLDLLGQTIKLRCVDKVVSSARVRVKSSVMCTSRIALRLQ